MRASIFHARDCELHPDEVMACHLVSASGFRQGDHKDREEMVYSVGQFARDH